MSAGDVAVAQWRIAPGHRDAVTGALAAGTRRVQLDVGGPGRGPALDDAVLTELRRHGAVVDALAVNRANDLGLHRDGRPSSECLDLLLASVALARRHGVPAVHVPSFRASAIVDAASFAATAQVLARCADEGGPDLLVLTESTLGADDAVALVSAAGAPTVRVVADTGNLVDAGHDPATFVATCRDHGVLAPAIHVKVPAGVEPGEVATRTRTILAQVGGDVLLENDYRARPDLLAADVAAAYDRGATRRHSLAGATLDPPTLPRTRPTEGASR
ncbi:sugar phosphate isomerase/epimerase family protein [Aeromicrobium sp.]|uniref:sugar phosphate isomerase/epimerase family protein n=1 Tax=Aeromicrobium sp. TaxID=1871063 RepID=UPI003510DD48